MADVDLPASSEHLLVELEAGVCTLTFDRPRKKNAFTIAMYEAMTAAFRAARQHPGVRVVLLRGNGGVFTAGNDLQDFMQSPPTGVDSPVAQLLAELEACEKPLVAAVTGPAIGIGVTCLLHCDLVYAGAGARLHLPFVDLGLCPEAGSSYLLPRLMGPQRAAELLLLGEPFSAETAERYGLVNAVVADDEVHAHAHAVAVKLAQKPAAAVRASKQLMRARTRDDLREAMHAEYEVFARRLRSPEAMEAFQAFFERRPPDFSKFD